MRQKSLLVSAAMLLMGVSSAFAAKTAPTVTGLSWSEALGQNVYLYNEGMETFLTGSNYWGTRAAAFNNGAISSGNNIQMSDVAAGILNGEITIKKEPTDLNYLMKSIKQLFKFRCPETVSLTWNKRASPVSMETDANRITQVFSNLISNALKHTPKGVISFGYELLSDTQEIRFFVKDTGTGIDPKFIEHIFDA